MVSVLFLVSLILPGFLFLPKREGIIIERMMLAMGCAVAYWILSFWYLSLIPLPIPAYIALSLGMTLLLFVRNIRYRTRGKLQDLPALGIVTGFLLLILVPQFELVRGQLVPAGFDMSMHTYIARAIVDANGFPKNLLPMVPVTTFGNYPFGFSILVSLAKIAGGIRLETSALVITAFSHLLFDISLYLLLRRKFTPLVSALVAFVLAWFSAAPHLFISWGANPTVLSFALLLLSLSQFPTSEKRSILPSVMLFFASFLTNYMLPIALVYILLPFLIIYRKNVMVWIKQHIDLSSVIVTFLFIAPFVFHFVTHPFRESTETANFIHSLHNQELVRWSGHLDGSLFRMLWELFRDTFHPVLLLLYAAGIVGLFFRNKRAAGLHLLWVGMLILLILNANYWFLPLSSMLYPFRISTLLLLPMALLFGTVVTAFQTSQWKDIWIPLIICLLSIWGYRDIRIIPFLQSSRENTVVGKNDLEAFRWIQANITDRDVILNSYFDAGLWIPALAGKKIVVYHTNPVDYDAVEKAKTTEATYAYVGSKQTDTINQLLQNIGKENSYSAEPVYANTEVTVYRLWPEGTDL